MLCIRPRANARSVPGRMGTHSSALAAAGDIRGSTVTTRMPRILASAIRFAEPGKCRWLEKPSPEPICSQ